MSRRAIDMNRMPAIVNPFTVFNVQTQHWPSRYSIMTVALCWSTSCTGVNFQSFNYLFSINFGQKRKWLLNKSHKHLLSVLWWLLALCYSKLPDSQWYVWNSYEGGHCVQLTWQVFFCFFFFFPHLTIHPPFLATRHIFFMHVKEDLHNGHLRMGSEQAEELSALLAQAEFGDYNQNTAQYWYSELCGEEPSTASVNR